MVARAIASAKLVLVSLSAAVAPRASMAHPLHTTLTEVTVDRSRHTVRAVVRVFADDIAAALARRAGGRVAAARAPSDTDAWTYVSSSLVMTGGGAGTLPLRSCGIKRSADLLWVCAEATIRGGIRALSLKNSILCDLYSDQVNIVQVPAADGTPTKSFLFTRGDGAKPLL